jgi:predicted ArsR family transcriptional regulator
MGGAKSAGNGSDKRPERLFAPAAVGARVAAEIAAVASLDEPTRRQVYEFLGGQSEPVSRDEVAEAVGVSRRTAAFHLDRLADEGLVAVSFARRSGRTGPGAGRPAKLYQRSVREVSVSLPPRHYDLVGSLLAGAIVEAEESDEPPRAVLDRRARDLGCALAGDQHDARVGEQGGADGGHDGHGRDELLSVLERHGYEPQVQGTDIVLQNCPFHAMAQEHTELVCGMNLHLLEGVLDALPTSGLRARLDPSPSRCCVRLGP